MADGLNYECKSIVFYGPNLYAGGFFTNSGSTQVNYVAKWDGTAWSALGNGIGNICNALVGVDAGLYIGGEFSSAGNNIPTQNITSYTFNYINLVFNSQIVSTLYNNSSGSQVNTYLSGATTYASVTNNIPFYQ